MGRVTYTLKIRQDAKEDGHHLITFDACDPKRNGERFTIAVRMPPQMVWALQAFVAAILIECKTPNEAFAETYGTQGDGAE